MPKNNQQPAQEQTKNTTTVTIEFGTRQFAVNGENLEAAMKDVARLFADGEISLPEFQSAPKQMKALLAKAKADEIEKSKEAIDLANKEIKQAYDAFANAVKEIVSKLNQTAGTKFSAESVLPKNEPAIKTVNRKASGGGSGERSEPTELRFRVVNVETGETVGEYEGKGNPTMLQFLGNIAAESLQELASRENGWGFLGTKAKDSRWKPIVTPDGEKTGVFVNTGTNNDQKLKQIAKVAKEFGCVVE